MAADDREIHQSVLADSVIADLEQQLGAAMGQNARLRVLLRERDRRVQFLTEQLAARDAEHPREHATSTP